METIAAVVLPEPTHFIGRLPEGDDDVTTRVRLLKDVGDVFASAVWPDVVGLPTPGRAFAYHFDGAVIDLVRDETSRTVWRLDQNR